MFNRLSLFLLFPFFAGASANWITLTTPHFEMFTTNPAKDAAQEIQFFEHARWLLLEATPLKTKQDTVVQIIAFRSESEYAPYGFRAGGGAYYLRTFNRDYIVMQDIDPRHRQIVTHEYTHLLVAAAGLKLPIWLNEGLAELYSSIESRGGETVLGHDPSQHLTTLGRRQWIDWNALFAVDRNSPYYNESQKMSVFYAQSWALTHMLALGPAYAPRFNNFLQAVSAGQPSVVAFQTVYGKSLGAVDADLKTYLHQKTLPESVFEINSETAAIQPKIAETSDFEIDFALATLLSAKPSTLVEANSKLVALAGQHPERPEPEESLGYLALQQNRTEEARSHFALAIERHSSSPEIIYRYAELQQDAAAPDSEVMGLLGRVLAIKPDFEEARLDLGLLTAKHSQFESALSMLMSLKTIPDDQAFAVYSTIAECNLHCERPDIARTYAQKAKEAAKDEDERQQADDLLKAAQP
ncbi:MAG: hypothetical protein WB992_08455 [Bryobacteraceae bacterium]